MPSASSRKAAAVLPRGEEPWPKARLSRLAEQDLLDIWTYIAKDNSDAADRFTDLLIQKCDNLCDFLEVGTRRDELAPSLRCLRGKARDIVRTEYLTRRFLGKNHLRGRRRSGNRRCAAYQCYQ